MCSELTSLQHYNVVFNNFYKKMKIQVYQNISKGQNNRKKGTDSKQKFSFV